MPALALSVLVGILAGLWIPTSTALLPAWLLLTLAPPVWWLGGRLSLAALVGFVCAELAAHNYQGSVLADEGQPTDLLVTGIISDFPRVTSRGYDFTLDLTDKTFSATGLRRLRLATYDFLLRPAAGELWQLKVRLKPPRGQANPGTFDRAAWLLSKRVHATGYVRESLLNRRIAPVAADGWSTLRFRAAVRRRLEAVAGPHSELPLLTGITVGARDGLSKRQWSVLRDTGTNHLMAISGLHIGLVAGLLWYLGLVLGMPIASYFAFDLPRRSASILSGGGAFLYAMLAGLSLPTARALCMVMFVIACNQRQRSIIPLASLGFALAVVLFADPFAILSQGFWLSFVAVALLYFCLVRIIPAENTLDKFLLPVRRLINAQWVLGIGLAIPTAIAFGQLSLLAPLANIVAVPLFGLFTVPVALSGLVLLTLNEFLGDWLLNISLQSLTLLMSLLQWMSALPVTTWRGPGLSPGPIMLSSIGCLILLIPRPILPRWPAPILLLLALLSDGQEPGHKVSVRVLDVGQGLAVIVRSGMHTLLYDAGPAWPDGDAGRQTVVPVMRYLGIDKIDMLIVSHGDNDHRGGVAGVLEAMEVDEIVAPAGMEFGSRRVTPCRLGQNWQWGNAEFEVLHPRDSQAWSDNNASCVLQIFVDGHSVLLPGDIEAVAESVLLGRDSLVPAQLIVAPHHGSRTSSTTDFAEFLKPAYVVFTVGYMNRWRFPSREVTRRWSIHARCLLDTSRTGALTFEHESPHGFVLAQAAANGWKRPWPVRSGAAIGCANPL